MPLSPHYVTIAPRRPAGGSGGDGRSAQTMLSNLQIGDRRTTHDSYYDREDVHERGRRGQYSPSAYSNAESSDYDSEEDYEPERSVQRHGNNSQFHDRGDRGRPRSPVRGDHDRYDSPTPSSHGGGRHRRPSPVRGGHDRDYSPAPSGYGGGGGGGGGSKLEPRARARNEISDGGRSNHHSDFGGSSHTEHFSEPVSVYREERKKGRTVEKTANGKYQNVRPSNKPKPRKLSAEEKEKERIRREKYNRRVRKAAGFFAT